MGGGYDAAAQRSGAAGETTDTNGGVYSAAAASLPAASDGGTDARNAGACPSMGPYGAVSGRRRLRGKQTVAAAAAQPAKWRGTEPPG